MIYEHTHGYVCYLTDHNGRLVQGKCIQHYLVILLNATPDKVQDLQDRYKCFCNGSTNNGDKI